MSRKKRKQRANNSQLDQSRRDLDREMAVLSSKVRWDGSGEDPVVQAMLTKLATASNVEALEIALQLQELIRGGAAMIKNPELADALNKTRALMHEMDEAAEKADRDGQKFHDEAYEKGMKKMPTGDALDRLRVTAGKQLQNAMAEARVRGTVADMKLRDEINNGPKELVTVVPKMVMGRIGDSQVIQEEPVVIRIRSMEFRLGPGTYLVPKPVAEAYRNWKSSQDENKARQEALRPKTGEDGRDTKVFAEWDRISREYGSPTEKAQVIGVH